MPTSSGHESTFRARLQTYVLETWALAWLASLTVWNLVSGGQFRSALLFAVPVLAAASRGLTRGIVFAGLAALAACFGGALPSGPAADPAWVSGFWAFLRLSILSLCIQGIQFAVRRH